MTIHYPDVGIIFPGKANHRHFPDLGSDTSSVWNFSACSADVISRGDYVAKCRLFSQATQEVTLSCCHFRCVPRGNCTKHPKPKDSSPPRTTSTTATTVSPQCNPGEPKLQMLWAGQSLKTLFSRHKRVGLLAVGDFASELQFKRGDGDWLKYKGCRRDKIRVVSTDSVLR